MKTTLPLTGLPLIFSTLVSEAAMQLPALTRPQDTMFLETMTEVAIDAFWQNYVADLPSEAFDALTAATEEKSGQLAKEWLEHYADFKSDPAAAARADTVLQELRSTLPVVMKREYDSFTFEDIK